jgi:hypothetical protein
MSHNYDKFTFDLGELRLTKADKAGLETDFDGPGEYLVCSMPIRFSPNNQ